MSTTTTIGPLLLTLAVAVAVLIVVLAAFVLLQTVRRRAFAAYYNRKIDKQVRNKKAQMALSHFYSASEYDYL